jgi:translation initiation factor 3 subunit B
VILLIASLSFSILLGLTDPCACPISSPPLAQGKNILLAGLKSFNGQLEFYNVDDAETMATAEHFMCTDVDWDPTGAWGLA